MADKTPALQKHRFDRSEVAGSLGDLGTLLPLMVALIAINGLNATAVLAGVGIFYIIIGAWYRLPIPVQPFKVVAAIAIAQGISGELVAASGLLMAVFLIFLSVTNLITVIARLFSKPVIRGIQLGLGMTLLLKGGSFIFGRQLFLSGHSPSFGTDININLVIGIVGFLAALVLINNKKIPAAIVLVAAGAIAGLAMGALKIESLRLGFQIPVISLPSYGNFATALVLLALPQIPLTIGNAVIGTAETSKKLLGREESARVTPRALCFSMGVANIFLGLFGGMPCCHGAGGLAAHYRFGARTGGSNMIIGAAFVILALLLGRSALPILTLIPLSILGTLLAFAGLELSLMIVDVKNKTSLFVTIAIAGIAVLTKNMGIAFIAGIIIEQIMKQLKIEL